MRCNTRFSPGDSVWVTFLRSEERWLYCPFCSGTGRVIGDDGSNDNCPRCYGQKGRTIIGEDKWMVGDESPLTIGQVRFEYTKHGNGHTNTKIEYMCRETGVGSGPLFNEDNLCSSKEEAEAFCAEKNRALEEEKNRDSD